MVQTLNTVVYDSARRPHPFLEEWIELVRYRDLVVQWANRSIKIRYKRSILGVLWTLLEPLIIMAILTVVFSYAFRVAIQNYPIYVLTGLLMWDFFVRATTTMVKEMIASENLAHRIYVPISAFAVANVFAYAFNWLIALVPLMGIALVTGHPMHLPIITLPVTMGLVMMFALGVGLIVSTISVFFHDFSLMYDVLLRAWLYLTPIIYPIDIVPEHLRFLLWINPMTHYVRLLHDAVYFGRYSPLHVWALCGMISGLALLIGWWWFTRTRDAFAYRC